MTDRAAALVKRQRIVWASRERDVAGATAEEEARIMSFCSSDDAPYTMLCQLLWKVYCINLQTQAKGSF